ncbi:CmpA/NrtA family ABC transporter substrate-binding protein [Methylobacterium sp. A54F]
MRLQVGYIPLLDAAPLIAAHELGFARAEGLELDLSAEPSWATLRDRLALGHLDAAHMLAPLALASALSLSGPPSDLVVPLALSLNGNALTLSAPLWAEMQVLSETDGDAGEAGTAARAFARVAEARHRSGRPLTLGTVHPFSTHTYQIRLFAEQGGLDPAALRLVVVPPQHSVEALARGLVDGYCAGAPWSAAAVAAGLGRIAALGCDIAPNAPEKVLAVPARLGEATLPLVRAVAQAGLWCADPANRSDLAHRLARRGQLGLDAGLLAAALAGEIVLDAEGRTVSAPAHLRLGAPAQRPAPAQVRWLLAQMRAAGQIPPGEDIAAAAEAVYRPDLYAAAGLPA